jgi:hypothetical protein
MAGKDLIRYDLLVHDALKGVVRKVLIDAKDGLPGEHHFYITFRTDFPGVRLSNRLREKYPQEMMIVLQHQFWDLNVTEHTFEVGLSFSNIPERLLVPFDALVAFFDPSVNFGLRFLGQEGAPEDQTLSLAPAPETSRSIGLEPVELKQQRKSLPSAERKPAVDKAPLPVPRAPASEPLIERAAKLETADAESSASAEVVSLDSFRKKS